jgi:hypothetical protein
LVCSACGYENPVGNRFCGMCGTPLPHRPLTIPGAQGTHSFTRVPLEVAKPPEQQPATAPPEETNVPTATSRTGVLIEMPSPVSRSPETPQSENFVPPASDMVPEVPLDEFVKSFTYVPPADPKEITMRGDVPVLQPEAVVTDTPATAPTGATAGDKNLAPTEDVRERLGLGDAPEEERRDRPRFLDFSEPPPSPEKPAKRESNVVSPSFLGLNEAPQIAAKPARKTENGRPGRGSWRILFASAVLLVFVVLAVLEWRSRVNQTNDGPVEIITMKIREIGHSNSQAPQPAGAADSSISKPTTQVEVTPTPQAQDQNAAASPSVPSSTSANSTPAALDAHAGANAARPPQKTTAATANQPRAGQEAAKPAPSSSAREAQTPTGQKTAQSRKTPLPNTPKAATETADAAANKAEEPKPKLRSAQEGGEEAPTEKSVPGEEEMAKANNASDSAAAAAWLWKATAKGNPDAPVRLAGMYIKGEGVPRNCEQALVLLKTAAAKENARASTRLATLYNSGTCVQRNRVEAYRWLSSALAADPNNRSARQNRDLIWQQMTPDERAAAEQYR